MITHPFFGDVDDEYWEKTFIINGKPSEVLLEGINHTAINVAKLDEYAKFIQNLDYLDKKARRFLLDFLSCHDGFITYYLDEIDSYQDSDVLSQFFASNQSTKTFVDLLSLTNVCLEIDNNLVVFDYMIDPDVSDQILAVQVDLSGQMLDCAWES